MEILNSIYKIIYVRKFLLIIYCMDLYYYDEKVDKILTIYVKVIMVKNISNKNL